MKAVRFHEFGGPDVLRYEDADQPVPGAGQVRVRVAGTSFNGVDANIRGGNMQGPIPVRLPHTPGIDVAGTVDALGEGVGTLAVGDRVIGFLPMVEAGAAAEYVIAPAEILTAAPTTVPLADAAALPAVGLTAWQALFEHAELTAGQRVLINGAGGAVGGYAVQLAKADGLRVVADASEQDEALVKELGADVVLRRGAEYPDRVRAEIPEGVDGVVDAASLAGLTARAVRDGGRVVTLRGFDGPGERDIVFEPIVVFRYARERASLDRLRQQVEEGLVTLRVAKTLPAEQAAEAHRLLAAGGVRGRLILTF
jgi:NADPH:quinone reductase-like Zn-dependent oxidoreductase